MSWVHIERVRGVEHEYLTSRAALAHVESAWSTLAGNPEWQGRSLSQVREALERLEGTYVIRLFSEFEGILLDHISVTAGYRRMPRTAEGLINRVSLRQRLTDEARDGAHHVRQYRNGLVHPAAPHVTPLSFGDARRALNVFLAPLPDPP